jgi:hypothetical protein
VSTTRVRVRVDSPSASYFSRLAVVFADPIRLKIVTELFRHEMSPSQFYGLYGGGSLSRVDRHFKRLAEHDWLRLVRRESGGGRRGGTQNFYRAPKLAVFENEDWASLSNPIRTEFSWRIFEQFAERVKHAFEAGTFDGRPERHFTWTPLVLDEAGRKRVLGRIDGLFTALFEEQADARVRLAHSGEAPMHVTVGLAAFDSPREQRNRSGLVLPDPPSDHNPDDPAFTVRVARVFASQVNLKIVTECSLREMSPSQFAEEIGGGQVPEIARRFKMLSDEGWLVEVRKESGGRRRGGIETFYRATGPAIFDTRNWAQVPDEIRECFSWSIFEQLAEQVREAMDAGTFDKRPDRHHTWTPCVLDEQGWRQVLKSVDRVFYEVLREHNEAKLRLRQSDAEPLISTVYLACFESPEPEGADTDGNTD